uniref:VHS domain-containing protein n=2 Tax=Aegilops tauschii subsp. strangulata TaxID=200361 RepID=A0A453RUG2_AEGTS
LRDVPAWFCSGAPSLRPRQPSCRCDLPSSVRPRAAASTLPRLNADRWQTKDLVKVVEKRMQNKDPKVSFFTLTLLETMTKNCGKYVHSKVVDQPILQGMV